MHFLVVWCPTWSKNLGQTLLPRYAIGIIATQNLSDFCAKANNYSFVLILKKIELNIAFLKFIFCNLWFRILLKTLYVTTKSLVFLYSKTKQIIIIKIILDCATNTITHFSIYVSKITIKGSLQAIYVLVLNALLLVIAYTFLVYLYSMTSKFVLVENENSTLHSSIY